MSKKDFKESSALAFLSSKKDQEKHEVQDTQEVPTTQGRKGQKLQRINMAFSDENIEYLRIISRAKGVSMTQYVNDLLDVDRSSNSNFVKQLKDLLGVD